MRLSDFNYHLPADRIAFYPLPGRDSSRLLVVHREKGRTEHRLFSDISEYLFPGDVLVLNDTKVLPARLCGVKSSGGRVEILLLRELRGTTWQALVKGLNQGKVILRDGFTAWVSRDKGIAEVTFDGLLHKGDGPGDTKDMLMKIGVVPLPPYIKRETEPADAERYQTVYAKHEGAVAAPTAGLHFTEDLMQRIRRKGIEIAQITLHVGYGTFQPVSSADIGAHRMDEECYEISEDSARVINRAKAEGRRVVAVGTTVTRALEASAIKNGGSGVRAGAAGTSIFIYPGYTFKIIDSLVTNFHLPKSTPIMLASAFSGLTLLKKAYSEALALSYRFCSYGDAMLIT
jgi:S-adenosylmethionine:tRNA ribosyltransferase-isomerase